MVEACGTRRDELGTAGGEVFEHVGGDGIVDDDADGREARRQRCGTGSEKRVEVDELVPVTGVQLIEQRALVALSAGSRSAMAAAALSRDASFDVSVTGRTSVRVTGARA